MVMVDVVVIVMVVLGIEEGKELVWKGKDSSSSSSSDGGGEV